MSEQHPIRKPEVMSPAGYWPQLHAAIEAGADSVYFGLKHFTARAKVGFGLQELPEVMRTLHQRGARGFVTFNTLIFDHELSEAAKAVAAIAEAGADAVIIQDAGMLRLVREIAPDLEIHASTQMSITDAHGVRWAQRLGVQRVTLARELSLAELKAIREETGAELEVFVHGALCVAYSGQCFSSEAWGGRSANRGQCAQACRLPYDLYVDGRPEPLGDARYLLSPGDLYALHQVPELTRIGIAALKIEGRYKDADYVALATRSYRQAVDDAWAGLPLQLTPKDELQLEQTYSRGLGPFFLSGTNHQTVVQGRAPRHRGVKIGRVQRVQPDRVLIEPDTAHRISPLKPGDGVVFDAADWRSPEEREEGGRVYQVSQRGSALELQFGNGQLDSGRIRPGDLVWRTHDPDVEKAAKPFTQAASPVHRQPLRVKVTAEEGAPLRAEWTLTENPNISVQVESPQPLGRAQSRGVSAELIREQFGRLGQTPYELDAVELVTSGQPFVPNSLLNQLRRDAVDRLQARQAEPAHVTLHDPGTTLNAALQNVAVHAVTDVRHEPQLHLLVRTPEQLEAAIDLQPASITLDYLDLYGLRPSVDRLKTTGITARVATPRVLKPGEEKILQFLLRLDCQLLVRAAGILDSLRDQPHPALVGDFSLNAANALTADLLLASGLDRITPTHDLNAAQITELAREVGGSRIEAIVYQHLPVFHTEYCVFCRFLSTGTSYRDCGRPCEEHRVSLRDVNGRAHPVMADVGCRNTVFGAEAQDASLHLDTWRNAGISHFRLEFVHESAHQVRTVTRAFSDALRGRISAAQLSQSLRQAAPQGTTEGSLYIPASSQLLPILQ